jgi:SAM-dependent methyltransferase
MTEYILAHHGDDTERQRLALLDEFHGRLTLAQLEAAAVGPGWRCAEVGAGTGAMTSWLAERVAPTGHVLAMDLETHWLEPLRSEIVEIRQGDITRTELPPNSFDLILAQMLLLHLPDPSQTCRQLLRATVPGGQLIIHDADFTPVAIQNATELEAAGIAVMTDTMRAANVHLALGPELETLLRDAGGHIEHVASQAWVGRGGQTAALITAITIERFRDRAIGAGVSSRAVDAAITALHDPARTFTGPTRWIVRCHRSGRP